MRRDFEAWRDVFAPLLCADMFVSLRFSEGERAGRDEQMSVGCSLVTAKWLVNRSEQDPNKPEHPRTPHVRSRTAARAAADRRRGLHVYARMERHDRSLIR
jgi:hypothetical protein